eukprot:1154090-Pelagomonas_calceolata.AAC.12
MAAYHLARIDAILAGFCALRAAASLGAAAYYVTFCPAGARHEAKLSKGKQSAKSPHRCTPVHDANQLEHGVRPSMFFPCTRSNRQTCATSNFVEALAGGARLRVCLFKPVRLSSILNVQNCLPVGMGHQLEHSIRPEDAFGEYIDERNVKTRISQPNSFGLLLLAFIMVLIIHAEVRMSRVFAGYMLRASVACDPEMAGPHPEAVG